MNMRKKLDISAYLVVGPENTLGRPVGDIIRAAVENGFTCLQIRSKTASARELIALCREAADVLQALGKAEDVVLLVDDRLDVVLAAREAGIKVDGIHVGQSDIPVAVCRKFLGPEAVIGLSARTQELLNYVRQADTRDIDYFGAGPLHETATKPDCGRDAAGHIITRSFEELTSSMPSAPCRSSSAAASRRATCPPCARRASMASSSSAPWLERMTRRLLRASSWRPGRLHRVRDT